MSCHIEIKETSFLRPLTTKPTASGRPVLGHQWQVSHAVTLVRENTLIGCYYVLQNHLVGGESGMKKVIKGCFILMTVAKSSLLGLPVPNFSDHCRLPPPAGLESYLLYRCRTYVLIGHWCISSSVRCVLAKTEETWGDNSLTSSPPVLWCRLSVFRA